MCDRLRSGMSMAPGNVLSRGGTPSSCQGPGWPRPQLPSFAWTGPAPRLPAARTDRAGSAVPLALLLPSRSKLPVNAGRPWEGRDPGQPGTGQGEVPQTLPTLLSSRLDECECTRAHAHAHARLRRRCHCGRKHTGSSERSTAEKPRPGHAAAARPRGPPASPTRC